MPPSIDDVKASLVENLWLPLSQRGGGRLYPRLRKNKKMKLFTLTDIKFQEVLALEDNKLIKREDVVVWTHSFQQAFRLETGLGRNKKVLCEGRLESSGAVSSVSQ